MSKRTVRQITFADIFSGAGLFSAGLVANGFKQLLAVECDRLAAKTYFDNVGGNVRVGSVTDYHNIPLCDVLIAGPPCQGFSTLGRRDPTDARNELCLSVLPWARASKAKVILIENVPPFLRSPHWVRLAAGLRRQGYQVSTWELDAVDFGTPQFRVRAFTVASKIGEIPAPKISKTRITAGEILLGRRARVRASDPMNYWPIPSNLAAKRFALIPPGGDKRDILKAAPALCPPSWAQVGCNATDVWGRIRVDDPANTIRCTFQNPSKGRYLHPFDDRVLSLREGARLQGVPDHWTFSGPPTPAARQIGNGVPVPLAIAVGNQLRSVMA